MKIRIAYLKNEVDKVQSIIKQVQSNYSGTKIKETPSKDGYLHTVLTIPKPDNHT